MRNGKCGVGFVMDSKNIDLVDRQALSRLDAVIVLDGSPDEPGFTSASKSCHMYQRDIYRFVMGDDDMATEKAVMQSTGSRVVFIGKPGTRTMKALKSS